MNLEDEIVVTRLKGKRVLHANLCSCGRPFAYVAEWLTGEVRFFWCRECDVAEVNRR